METGDSASSRLPTTGGRQSPQWFPVLLVITAFALPWSSDMAAAVGSLLSRLFNASLVLIILGWALTCRRPFRSMPLAFTVFALFIGIHTLLTYAVIHPGDLRSSDFEAVLGMPIDGAVPRFVIVIKLASFIMLGYAVAALSDGARDIKIAGFALGAGLATLLVLGRGAALTELGGRFSGGYANANAFAEVCLGVVFLNLHTMIAKKSSGLERIVAFACGAAANTGRLLTPARSAVVGLAVGLLALATAAGIRRGAWILGAGALMIAIVAVASSGGIFQLLYRRTTESVVDLRSLIWAAYLRHWQSFLLTGVGLGREMTVLDGTIFLDHVWPPHNSLLQTAVAYGFLGPVLLVAFLGKGIGQAWTHTRRDGVTAGAGLALAILCCWSALMLLGDRLSARIFWILLGLVFAILARTGERGPADTRLEAE